MTGRKAPPKLLSRFSTVAFVDTCAGRGIYADGHKGSPIIAAETNNGLPVGKRVLVYACDEDPEELELLQENMTPWTETTPPLAQFYHGDFQVVLPEILEEVRRYPTLFFIDPFKTMQVAPAVLQPILEARGSLPTDRAIERHSSRAQFCRVVCRACKNLRPGLPGKGLPEGGQTA